MLTAGRSPIPVVVVDTYGREATLAGLRHPLGEKGGFRRRLGCVGKVFLLVLFVIVVVIVLSFAGRR
jgi:hypothetical protein